MAIRCSAGIWLGVKLGYYFHHRKACRDCPKCGRWLCGTPSYGWGKCLLPYSKANMKRRPMGTKVYPSNSLNHKPQWILGGCY